MVVHHEHAPVKYGYILVDAFFKIFRIVSDIMVSKAFSVQTTLTLTSNEDHLGNMENMPSIHAPPTQVPGLGSLVDQLA
jgi:hypothetical protein